MKVRSRILWLALLTTAPLPAQIDKVLQGLGNRGPADDSKIASGLHEALRIGADHAVDLTGATDGFFKNETIKILLPEKLRGMKKPLRLAGMGPKLDEFELGMNRAAEGAAPAARAIFRDALSAMTFDDARKILSGGDTAATDYFKLKTTDKLTTAFRPPVEKSMAGVGVVKQYQQLTAGLPALPFTQSRNQSLDISAYVTSKTLDGLFYMLAQEEKKIRTQPAAQITPLLKQIFGKH